MWGGVFRLELVRRWVPGLADGSIAESFRSRIAESEDMRDEGRAALRSTARRPGCLEWQLHGLGLGRR